MELPYCRFIPDPVLAEAFEDLFLPDYTFRTFRPDKDVVSLALDDSTFPPEPMEIANLVGAYLEDTPLGRIDRRKQAIFPEIDVNPDKIIELYSSQLSVLQEAAPAADNLFAEHGGIKQFYLDILEQEGKKLISAHIVGRIETTQEVFGALAYPKAVYENIPVGVREAFAPILGKLAQPGKKAGDENLSQEHEASAADTLAYDLGAVAAANFLAKTKIVKRNLYT
jgi:hypothetical protein